MPYLTREAILSPLTKAVVRPGTSKLILGNGSSSVDGVATIALPAAFLPDGVYEFDLNGNERFWLGVFIEALGAAGLTGVVARMDFQDPLTGWWFPSAEGVARGASAAAHEITLLGAGSMGVFPTRVEHRRLSKGRVLFRAAAGAADAATIIRPVWYPDSPVPAGAV